MVKRDGEKNGRVGRKSTKVEREYKRGQKRVKDVQEADRA